MASWQRIAKDNLRLARIAAQETGGERTACSRAYYAAFSGLTAYLVGTSATFPSGQVTPRHRDINRLIQTHGDPLWQDSMSNFFSQLYKLRLDADYRNGVDIDRRLAEVATKLAVKILFSLGVS